MRNRFRLCLEKRWVVVRIEYVDRSFCFEQMVATVDIRKPFPTERIVYGRPSGSQIFQNIPFYLDPEREEESPTVVRQVYTNKHQLTLPAGRYPNERDSEDGISYSHAGGRNAMNRRVKEAPYNITFTLYADGKNDDHFNLLRSKELDEKHMDYLCAYDYVWKNLELPKPTREEIRANWVSECKVWQIKGSRPPIYRTDQKMTFPESPRETSRTNYRDGCEIHNATHKFMNMNFLQPQDLAAGMYIKDISFRKPQIWVRKTFDGGKTSFKAGPNVLCEQLTAEDDKESGIEWV